MDGFGFIHETLDIELLILFILNRLPGAVDKDTLSELTLCDGGINYFNFSEALANLVETGHVLCENGMYSSTEKGHRNGSATESSIPYSVRMKAERNIIPVARMLRRSDMIKTGSQPAPNGGYTVHLSLSDGTGYILSMDILAGSERQASMMESRFQKHAEDISAQIAAILTDES